METIFQTMKEYCQTGEAVALVLVAQSSEGTPGKAGAKMLVGSDGSLCGTVGGGTIEYHAIRTAKELLNEGTFHCEEYTLQSGAENKLGMICGGNTKLLFHVLRGREGIAFAEKGLQMCAKKVPYCMVVPIAEGTMEILDMQTYHCRREEMEQSTASHYTEFFFHEGKVYIFGGGHVAFELLPILANLNFRCVLLDDREEYANANRFPAAEEIHLVDYQTLDLPIEKEDLAVIMTRGHQFDTHCERFVLGTEASYIGVMGSLKKADHIRQTLLEEGFTEERLNRIVTPIGLSIGSETPQEIAISIAAQLIQVRAKLRKTRENRS